MFSYLSMKALVFIRSIPNLIKLLEDKTIYGLKLLKENQIIAKP